jgi:hypothetical protein
MKASEAFCSGKYIYELAGLVPTDNLADYSNLSLVITHVGEILEP